MKLKNRMPADSREKALSAAPGKPPARSTTEFVPLKERAFTFRCHPGIECFNLCCADLRLLLTPFDILRLKKRLNLSSSAFLERYARVSLQDHVRFPMMRLKMSDAPGKPCPFVSTEGCRVYEDRPGACRIYPLGRASSLQAASAETREEFFLVKESHCRGFEEDRRWSLAEWFVDQGMPEYTRMNDLWMQVLADRRSLGPKERIASKLQMFSMVSYNLDRFREFVFNTRFLQTFQVERDTQEEIMADDSALFRFGIHWLKFSLFGDPTLRLRTEKNSSA